MKPIVWDPDKNEWLKQYRQASFEEIEELIINNNLIGTINHPNQSKYGHQRQFIVRLNNYIYYVPFVEDDQKIFLKTIVPSRKLAKKYAK